MNETYFEQLHDNYLRADVIIHLAAAMNYESICDALEEALHQDWDRLALALDIPVEATEDACSFTETITRKKKFGFLVRMVTPVPTHFYDDGGYSSSWHHYQGQWFYGEALETVYRDSVDWRNEEMARWREEAADAR